MQADRAVAQREQRLARGFEVAMRHSDGGLFVQAGQKLGHFVAAVVDQRLMQGAKAGGAIGGQVLDVERLDDIDHEVRAGNAFGVAQIGGHAGLSRCTLR